MKRPLMDETKRLLGALVRMKPKPAGDWLSRLRIVLVAHQLPSCWLMCWFGLRNEATQVLTAEFYSYLRVFC